MRPRGLRETEMISRWLIQRSERGVCGSCTPSRAFARSRQCAASSVIRKRVSSPSCGAQKNTLRRLRPCALGLVRPAHAAGTRSVLRGHAHLPGDRGAARSVPRLRWREARAARVPRRQPLLYQALCALRGPALPAGDDQGHRPGIEPRLGHRSRRWRSSTCAPS